MSKYRPGSVYGSQHRSVVALIDGKYYDVDANTVLYDLLAAAFAGEPQDADPYELSDKNYALYLIGQRNYI